MCESVCESECAFRVDGTRLFASQQVPEIDTENAQTGGLTDLVTQKQAGSGKPHGTPLLWVVGARVRLYVECVHQNVWT